MSKMLRQFREILSNYQSLPKVPHPIKPFYASFDHPSLTKPGVFWFLFLKHNFGDNHAPPPHMRPFPLSHLLKETNGAVLWLHLTLTPAGHDPDSRTQKWNSVKINKCKVHTLQEVLRNTYKVTAYMGKIYIFTTNTVQTEHL